MGYDAVEPDRRDPRNRALRHLLQSVSDYDADRERRETAPAARTVLIPASTQQALERMSDNVARVFASFRTSAPPEDGGAATRYDPRPLSVLGDGTGLFDAEEFARRRTGDPHAALRGIDGDPLSGDLGADVFDADYFDRQTRRKQ